jgi:hypothetical protein
MPPDEYQQAKTKLIERWLGQGRKAGERPPAK